MNYVERYYICGGEMGTVRVFDREHGKCISGVSFDTIAEAEEFVSELTCPHGSGFGNFMKKARA